MVGVNKCILLGILLSFTGTCLRSNKSELSNNSGDFSRYPRLIEYTAHDSLEMKALFKIREYLDQLELDQKNYYIGRIEYFNDSENLDQYANYTILIELLHLETVVYFDSVRNINQNLVEDISEELNEVFVPKSGNISGKDRMFYYNAETDSLDGILIQ